MRSWQAIPTPSPAETAAIAAALAVIFTDETAERSAPPIVDRWKWQDRMPVGLHSLAQNGDWWRIS